MTEENRKKIISNDYINLFIEPNIYNMQYAESVNGVVNKINDRDAVIYLPIDKAKENPVDYRYPALPRLFGLLDQSNLEAMKVDRIQNIPSFDLRGQGVLLGFIDTGVEYTNPVFQYADKTSRIVSIWDQTIENLQASEKIFYYGTEYTKEEINLALQNEKPLSIVPSTDEIGHGTSIAGIAGGTETELFRGVSPLAEYVIVKLKPAKTTQEHIYPMPKNIICYQEDDIMFGMQYLFNTARQLNRPIAICVAIGTNQGSHDGLNKLNLMIADLSSRNGVAIVVATGQENLAGHHYFGKAEMTGELNEYKNTIALRIAEKEKNFSMEIWGEAPASYSIAIRSPSGDMLNKIPENLNRSVKKFYFENTTVIVEYYNIEPHTGDPLILVSFENPAPGHWYLDIYGNGENVQSGFHIWIPMSGFLKESTQISELTELEGKDPETTLTSPSDTPIPISVTAYNHQNNSILSSAGRGNTRNKSIKPDLAAPGVSILCPTLGNSYELKTGTSIAAAETVGVAAMILEWSIVKKNKPFFTGIDVKQYLLRGVNKISSNSRAYPNKEWGYGVLDIYESFSHID
ncbi:S8 family peptidase [Clostridium sp. KNHs205]|uniref:S8 family peptidase n=1 Tax=Clostridium sp. KNHs205 TaxID=1449050 RepID=UPI00051BD47A|nr:S8 family peptidase [Clostridium sp. KNHs205]